MEHVVWHWVWHWHWQGMEGNDHGWACDGCRYYSTPSAQTPIHPNIQYTMIPIGLDADSHKILNTAFDLKHGYLEKFLRDHKDNDAVWVGVTLSRPPVKGNSTIEEQGSP